MAGSKGRNKQTKKRGAFAPKPDSCFTDERGARSLTHTFYLWAGARRAGKQRRSSRAQAGPGFCGVAGLRPAEGRGGAARRGAGRLLRAGSSNRRREKAAAPREAGVEVAIAEHPWGRGRGSPAALGQLPPTHPLPARRRGGRGRPGAPRWAGAGPPGDAGPSSSRRRLPGALGPARPPSASPVWAGSTDRRAAWLTPPGRPLTSHPPTAPRAGGDRAAADPAWQSEKFPLSEAYVTLASKNSRFTDETEILKMSERHSGEAGTGAGNEVDSPIVRLKSSSFGDLCSTSSFQDSGYSELLKSCSSDNTDKELFGKKERGSTLIHEYPETSSLALTHSLESPTQRKRFVFLRKENEKTPDLCETPKVSGKKHLLRRRLDISFSLLDRDVESQTSSLESSTSQVPNLEENIPSSASGFPRQDTFISSVTSTLRTEEVTSSSQKLRLNFSQQKTSTVDDSKDDCGLFEVECISPIQGSNFKDSITHDFSDSSLCINENTYPELLGSSVGGTSCRTDEDIFVTPISNLVPSVKFNASQRFSPSAGVRRNISTPEDSGFNSLCLDKSEDPLSEQEGSFQELLQKHKGTLKVRDTIKKSRRLGRLRRLSTLREQGSQSETEEENQAYLSSSESTPATASDISESQPSSDNKSEDLSFKNLSKTPALQLVHELFMKSKRKRFQQNGAHELLEERDGGKIAVLQRVLAGLIGKKMGIEKLDILTELKYRNLKHVLAMVLDSLTAESLCSVWKVSRNWREIIVQDKKANRRRKLHITQLKTNSEGAVLNVEDAATRLHLLNRSALRSVQAQARTPGFQKEQASTFSPWGEVLTPIASSSATHLSSSKQEEYVKVAKTLFIDEALKPCPRCQSPAKYQPYKKRGLCSRTACGFDFCVLCLCAYHGSEECSRGAAKPRNRKDVLPGSAQSKRNLKRL
ncbi:LOW QUALITY PROTEIN: F-box only protein 43 [Oryx dammah]|uniref:LOW QUALITY PROTEIN: F-box only protein 43 n=1 Tax=Oryx dammah TaxID=59534 RepID=UPI001A9BDB9C|nr:LOW QUALITY PROTEIN: F-box only protein 43 [Oryx dammah]